MKYLFEEKMRIIKMIKGGASIRSVCKEYGIEYHGLKMWLAQYDNDGEEGLIKSKTPCRYTTKEKEEIVREHLKNKLTFSFQFSTEKISSVGATDNRQVWSTKCGMPAK